MPRIWQYPVSEQPVKTVVELGYPEWPPTGW